MHGVSVPDVDDQYTDDVTIPIFCPNIHEDIILDLPVIEDDHKVLFGRKDLTDFYRTALSKFFELRMNKICDYQEDDTYKEMVICGIWKIQIDKRLADNNIKVFRYNLGTMKWIRKPYSSFPSIQLLPFSPPSIWRKMIEGIIWSDFLPMLGYENLPTVEDLLEPNERYGARKIMGRSGMANILLERIFAKCNPVFMQGGVKNFRKQLYAHIIDRDFFKTVMSINFRKLTLSSYLSYAEHKTAIQRVAKERPNLTPLIAYIEPEQLYRDDLFSQALWVKKNILETPLVDTLKFRKSMSPIRSFESTTDFKWVMKAPHSIVQSLYTGKVEDNCNVRYGIPILARATQNLKHKIPAITIRHLFAMGFYAYSGGIGDIDKVSRVYHLYLNHVGELWKDQGYKAVKSYSKNHAPMHEVLDWLANEGYAAGYPRKNTTWLSMYRMSNEWHRAKIAINVKNNLTWDTPFDEIEIDGIHIKALKDSIGLATEGADMRHCVGTFDGYCHTGEYQVFALRDADGRRSTLGLNYSRGKYSLSQHYGKHNSPIPKDFEKVGIKVIKLLNKKAK